MEKILEFAEQDKIQALVNGWAKVTGLGAKVRESDGSVIVSSVGCPDQSSSAGLEHKTEDIVVDGTRIGSLYVTVVNADDDKDIENATALLSLTMNQLIQAAYEKKAGEKSTERMREGIAKFENLVTIIQDKTKSLNGIQGRQNILALNASIEAARAGDAGKGFAVVAKEVGNLSMQSKELNEEISKTILNISKAVHDMTSDSDAE